MADRHLVAGGTGNWNSTTNWAATEGGASGASFPVAGDAVFLNAGSSNANIIINVASACASIVGSGGYAGTVTYTSTLTTTSTVTYPSGMTVAGTGDHITVTGSTFTIACASGLTGGLRLGGTSQTYTLGAALVVAGTLLFNGSTSIIFAGAFNIQAGVFSDTMTVSAITMSGNITITGDAALSSATSTTFSGGFAFQAATCTVSGGQTVTITSIGSMTITGLTTSSTLNIFNGGTWNTNGLTVTNATTGTTLFNVTGGTVTLSAALSCSMTFAGNVTWASQTNLYAASGTPTLTYSSGTITVGTSVLSIASSCTINGMPLYSLLLTAALTLTCNTRFTCAGTLTLPNAAATFAGTSGWTTAELTNTALTAARIMTLTEGNEYIVTGNLTRNNTDLATETITLISSHASNKALFTLQEAATQDIAFYNPTRIDSRNGQTIFSYLGVITDSYGWSKTLQGGNILKSFAGATLAVAGVTKDNAGAVLGSCDCYLFKDNGNDTATFMGYQESNASTGAYSFAVWAGSSYFVVAFKAGATPVMDVTDRTLAAA